MVYIWGCFRAVVAVVQRQDTDPVIQKWEFEPPRPPATGALHDSTTIPRSPQESQAHTDRGRYVPSRATDNGQSLGAWQAEGAWACCGGSGMPARTLGMGNASGKCANGHRHEHYSHHGEHRRDHYQRMAPQAVD